MKSRLSRRGTDADSAVTVPASSGFADKSLRWIVAAVVLLVPLIVTPSGFEVFRLSKELALRAAAILIVALTAAMLITGQLRFSRQWLRQPAILLALAVTMWATIVAALSTNFALSVDSLIWVYSCVVFALAAYAVAARSSVEWMNLLFPPALINAVILLVFTALGRHILVTEEQIRQSGFRPHFFRSGLVGNPNDLGAYLLVPALAAVALFVNSNTATRRVVYACIAGVLAIALTAAFSVAAVGAYVVGLIVITLVVVRRPLTRAAVVACVTITVLVLFATYEPLRSQADVAIALVRERPIDGRTLDRISSNRLIPALAAFEMFKDHPFTGVGIGGFGWQYYVYKIRVEKEHSLRRSSSSFSNFGEAHNDHLQVLAVSGIPGYLLFAAALVLVARSSLRPQSSAAGQGEGRRSLAAVFGLPLAAAFATLTIAQFPLELAAPTVTTLFTAGLTVAWRDR